jgi:hypothetical protein
MTRGQTWVAISLAAVATASSVVVNLATDLKTSGLALKSFYG